MSEFWGFVIRLLFELIVLYLKNQASDEAMPATMEDAARDESSPDNVAK